MTDLNPQGSYKDISTGKAKAAWLYYFGIDKAEIKPAHKTWLKSHLAPSIGSDYGQVDTRDIWQIWVIGMASRTAGFHHNLQLSRKRAEAVRDYLGDLMRNFQVAWNINIAPLSEAPATIMGRKNDVERAFDRAVLVFAQKTKFQIIFPNPIEPAPSKVCPKELAAANETLRKSREVADNIVQAGLRAGATSDSPYWFARLYHYITQQEIAVREKLSHPCFLLHFIPVFYDSYFVAADAFMKQGAIPRHWQDHFALARLRVDPSQLRQYLDVVTKSVITGATAHIRVDMAPSVEKAYRSFSAKYSGVPPLDTYKPDFFERNRPVFEQVRLTLVDEILSRATGMAAMGGKSIDPDFAAQAAQAIGMGINVGEIYRWREEAWQTAKLKLAEH